MTYTIQVYRVYANRMQAKKHNFVQFSGRSHQLLRNIMKVLECKFSCVN